MLMKSLMVLMCLFLAFSTHPVILVASICLQSLIVSIHLTYMYYTPWFGFILFLIFMGGLMILFVYITSLASNEVFPPLNMKVMAPLGGLIFIYLGCNDLLSFNSMNLNFKALIIKMYSFSSLYLTLLIMIYLLVVLIISVSIISMFNGPLRSTVFSKH